MIFSFLGHLIKLEKISASILGFYMPKAAYRLYKINVKVWVQSNNSLKSYGQKTSQNCQIWEKADFRRFFIHNFLTNYWIALKLSHWYCIVNTLLFFNFIRWPKKLKITAPKRWHKKSMLQKLWFWLIHLDLAVILVIHVIPPPAQNLADLLHEL